MYRWKEHKATPKIRYLRFSRPESVPFLSRAQANVPRGTDSAGRNLQREAESVRGYPLPTRVLHVGGPNAFGSGLEVFHLRDWQEAARKGLGRWSCGAIHGSAS